MKQRLRIIRRSNFFVIYLLIFYSSSSIAQWSSNPAVNNPICDLPNDQSEPAIVTDGEGGAIIVWYDLRGGGNYELYAQRINAAGFTNWTTNGVLICNNTGFADGYYPRPTMVSDGTGGAIISWHDMRNGSDHSIFAQRINAAGEIQWAENGVAICTSGGNQTFPITIPDGNGGAFITWNSWTGPTDLYVQHINASGQIQWTTNGLLICNATGSQQDPVMIGDGAGGVILAWIDSRSGQNDIYSQKIDAEGVIQWESNGVALCAASGDQHDPTIETDGNAGAIVTWYDDRFDTNNSNIYAQRVNSAGVVQWDTNGAAICTAVGSQITPTIASDGEGGAFITWFQEKVSAQHIDTDGNIQWMIDGIEICPVGGSQDRPKIIADEVGGAVICWYDFTFPDFEYNVYAQRINSSGANVWNPDGVPISTAPNNQIEPLFIYDDTNGGIITWFDYRNGSTNVDVFAQHICPVGTLGSCSYSEINVQGNGITISDGDTTPSISDGTEFGNVNINTALIHTFSIQNEGDENLYIGSLSLSGEGASHFSVSGISPASPIPIGNTASFTVTFSPDIDGIKTAMLNIPSNDENESNYNFLLRGTSVPLDSSAVGIGTLDPAPSSILDVQSFSRGVLIPRMSTEERNAILNPAEGLLVYDSDQHAFFYYNGTVWKKFSSE